MPKQTQGLFKKTNSQVLVRRLHRCGRQGIEDFHPHDLRHTCATWLVQVGVPIREVAELLRHSNIQVTMRYAHLAPNNVRDAVDRLSHYRPTDQSKGEGEKLISNLTR